MIANIIRNAKKTVTGGDPYYSAVSLLLPMDGTNGSTTFTDSGPNAIAVTASGSAQISTAQSKFGGASGYFDGSGDYLDIPYGNSLNITTDYTIEFWMRADSVTGYAPIFSITSATTSFFGGIYVVRNGSAITFETRPADGSGSSVIGITGGSISTNTWYHVAASVSGNSARLFINGVQIGSTTTFTTRTFTPTGARIGRFANNYISGLVDFAGYIDDLRISQFARYTSSFTPPTAALPTTASSTPADPYYGYTSLLLHMDGSSGSTNFVDSGPSALAVTAVGNAQISTTQSKYGGASAYFDGAGDYLDIPYGNSLNITTDYTIEFWMRADSVTGYAPIFTITSATTSFFGGIYVVRNGSAITFETRPADGSGSSVIAITGGSISTNTWYHVAASVSGNSARLFINGVQIGSTTTFPTRTFTPTGARIGRFANNFITGLVDFQGYLDDLRITKYARYTSAFAPPAQAHLEYANGNDRHFSNVSLLLHMDGANGSTTFTDNSANALAITRTGTAAISTAQSQFGGASAYFDGSTGYLSLTGNSSFQFGTGDFTIEAWVYISANAANQQTFLDTRGTATATPFTFGIYQSKLAFYDGTMRQSSATVTTGQWYHFSACRSGGTLRLFIDGISYYSASSTTNFTTGANSIYIGRGFDAAAYYTNGFIDDIRISKFARHSANFTPPTSAFPNA